MLTPAQVAQRANVHVNTVRNYSTDYADLLSPAARGTNGPRLYSDNDVETICAIAALRKSGVPPADVVAHLQARPVIDVEATAPQESPQTAYNALQAPPLALSGTRDAYNALQARLEAMQRAEVQRQLWSHGVAFYLGMLTAGVIFFATWLLVNGR